MGTEGDRVELEGAHCTMRIERVATGVILLTITGRDAGELGDAPFRALDRLTEGAQRVAIFVDAREGSGATIDVSGAWAQWFTRNRARLTGVTMLTGSRLVSLTADFVRRFAALDDTMRVTGDAAAFEAALAAHRAPAS